MLRLLVTRLEERLQPKDYNLLLNESNDDHLIREMQYLDITKLKAGIICSLLTKVERLETLCSKSGGMSDNRLRVIAESFTGCLEVSELLQAVFRFRTILKMFTASSYRWIFLYRI